MKSSYKVEWIKCVDEPSGTEGTLGNWWEVSWRSKKAQLLTVWETVDFKI